MEWIGVNVVSVVIREWWMDGLQSAAESIIIIVPWTNWHTQHNKEMDDVASFFL